jgi:hypothetical protein
VKPRAPKESCPRDGPVEQPELDGLNDVRPHVVHFSGHAGDAAAPFDNARVDNPEGREVPFELLVRALGATAESPKLLVLNDCDTLEGAEVLLEVTPIVIAMALARLPPGVTPAQSAALRQPRRRTLGERAGDQITGSI